MIKLQNLLPALLLPLSGFANPSVSPLSEFQNFFSQPVLGSCSELASPFVTKLAVDIEVEVGFVLLDRQDGYCQLIDLGMGTKNGIEIPKEIMNEVFADKESLQIQKVHSHPISNVAYFSEDVPYFDEIMFANEEAIRSKSLPQEDYDRLVHAISNGEVPGFNLSPPSLPDFLYMITQSKSKALESNRFSFNVITSGGIWSYGLKAPELSRTASESLYKMNSYAMMANAAYSPSTPDEKRKGVQQMLKALLSDPERGPLIEAWAKASLELRAPYSIEALRAYLETGDTELIEQEFSAKLEQAQIFSDLLDGMGISVEFKAFE